MSEGATPKNPILQRLYTLDGAVEVERTYDQWADDYERDTVGGMGYAAPVVAAGHLAELVPATARVLDAGCGTGLVGAELGRLGFTTIDGVDLSGEMLAAASAKGAYRRLARADLTARIDVASGSYDAVICVGTFTHGHVGPAALAELLRTLVPGGVLVATVLSTAWTAMGFAPAVQALADSGVARGVDVRPDQAYHRIEELSCVLLTIEAA